MGKELGFERSQQKEGLLTTGLPHLVMYNPLCAVVDSTATVIGRVKAQGMKMKWKWG